MNRRTFLHGLIASAAVAAVAVPVVAEAAQRKGFEPLKPIVATARVECGPGIIHMDGVQIQTGDCILVEYQTCPADSGIYVVKAVHNGSEVELAHVRTIQEGVDVVSQRRAYTKPRIIQIPPGRYEDPLTLPQKQKGPTPYSWPTPRRRAAHR